MDCVALKLVVAVKLLDEAEVVPWLGGALAGSVPVAVVVARSWSEVAKELLACLLELESVLEAVSGVLDAEVLAVVEANTAGAPERALPLRIKPSISMERISLNILNGHTSHYFHNTDFGVFVK